MERIVLTHVGLGMVVSVAFFFLSEPLVGVLFPDYHDVGLWLLTLAIGLAIILSVTATSLVIRLIWYRRQGRG